MKYNIKFKVGIYRLINTINNKFYIGSTTKGKDRWYEHMSTLKNQTHHNDHLQKAYNKYGRENFKFELLKKLDDNLTREEVFKEEQVYLDENFKNKKYMMYNISEIASVGPGMKGKKHSEETKRKISESLKGKAIGPHSKEHNRKVSEALKKYKWPKSHGQHISEAKRKAVVMMDPITKLEMEKFSGAREVKIKYPNMKSATNITQSCRTGSKAYGYYWKYIK